jgi:hypothetical protein
MFSLVSLYFVSFVLFFVLIFLRILFLLGFPIFVLVFPCIAPLCLFCVFFGFYSSANLLHVCFAALHPLSGLFLRPTMSSASFSVQGLLARDRFYFLVFLVFFACNKSCLDWPAFECDAWSKIFGLWM